EHPPIPHICVMFLALIPSIPQQNSFLNRHSFVIASSKLRPRSGCRMGLLLASAVALIIGIASAYLLLRAQMAVFTERISTLEQRLQESSDQCQKLSFELSAKTATLLATSN